LIREEYERLRDQEGWNYMDIRITGFEEFRDQYGFIAADEAVSLAAKVITEVVAEQGTQNDFLGTSSEAGFAIFTHAKDIDTLKQKLIETFDERSKSLYNFMDVEQGYMLMHPGTPEERKAPLMKFEIVAHQTAAAS
jgi:hypothetical protein